MRHHPLSAAIGIGLFAVLVPLSATSASAADPYGYWRKADQGERPAKMQVHRCGSGGRYLCVKIVWLQNPFDSKGNLLRDIRNSNPSQRGREIMGLPIVRGMAKVGANQWKGNIYNPEDGNTYSATLTLVSRNKIVLKGCKAFLLCGERVWLRTSPPPQPEPESKPEEQIEASAEPGAAPVAAAESAPEAATAATAMAEPAMPESPKAEPEPNALGNAEMVTPAAQQSAQPGYRFLNSASAEEHAGFTGESVPSMFVMTKPIEGATAANAAARDTAAVAAAETAAVPAEPKPDEQPAPVPVAQPKAAPQLKPQPVAGPVPEPQPKSQTRTIQANAAPAPQPKAAVKPAPVPVAPAGEAGEAEPTVAPETADTAEASPPRQLTWRERRKLRRQQRLMQGSEGQGLLPWLR